jgi:hypothetical protein
MPRFLPACIDWCNHRLLHALKHALHTWDDLVRNMTNAQSYAHFVKVVTALGQKGGAFFLSSLEKGTYQFWGGKITQKGVNFELLEIGFNLEKQ